MAGARQQTEADATQSAQERLLMNTCSSVFATDNQ